MIETTRTQTFLDHRAMLTGLAYRMLGSMADAEDVVQETWLRWDQNVPDDLVSARSWLCKIATNLCLDQLKSARAWRETYVGPWLPEPALLPADEGADSGAQNLSYGLLVALERLNPMERAVFLLHHAFDFRFAEIGEMLDLQTDHCRQLTHRARKRLGQEHSRFEADQGSLQRLTRSFRTVLQTGELGPLTELFKRDIVLYADGGARIIAARRPIHGPDKVARFWRGIFGKMGDATWSYHEISGSPAWLIHSNGRPELFVTLEVDETGITAMYLVRNPDKLEGLKRLATS